MTGMGRSNGDDADAFGCGFEDLQADFWRQVKLKRVRPRHSDKLPALEANLRLTCTSVLQVGNDRTRRVGTDLILAIAAMTGDACRSKHETQCYRSGEKGDKTAEHAQYEQSFEG